MWGDYSKMWCNPLLIRVCCNNNPSNIVLNIFLFSIMNICNNPSSSFMGRCLFTFLFHLIWLLFLFTSPQAEPIIEITASELRLRKPVNVTCIARENEVYSHKYDSKPISIYWFYNGNEVKHKCFMGLPVTSLTCSLVIDSLTSKVLGNYTCKASTSDLHCSVKHYEIDIDGKKD